MYMPPFEKLDMENKDDLLKEISVTKRKMARLKREMEHPFYKDKEKKCPTDLTIFKCDRDFLERLILRYISMGGDYKQGALEKRDCEFNKKISQITKVTLNRADFFHQEKRLL